MYILGIRNSGFSTSCALMKNGRVISAICEERLNREKYTKKFPSKSLAYCLSHAGITLKDVDHVAIAWNPGINLERMYTQYSERQRFIPEFLYSVANHLIVGAKEAPYEMEEILKFRDSEIRIHFLEHHMCHAAFGYYTSNYRNASILSMDAWGEKASTVFARAAAGRIEKIWEAEFPQSLGMFYQAITEFLGFTPNSDEWKVMGASSYGEARKFKKKISRLIHPTEDGKYEIDLSYFDFMSFSKKRMFTDKLVGLLGEPRDKSSRLDKRHFDIAAALQHVFEETVFNILEKNYSRKYPNLCLGGGCAMNCLLNGKVARRTRFKDVSVSFAPDDSGASIGAAYLLWNTVLHKGRNAHQPFLAPYLSRPYTDDEIKSYLDSFKIPYSRLDDPAKTAARLVADGRIVGWFQGGMEFGSRALGNRSILADPRRADMKDRINKAVKFRESFRPFAPAVLDEYGAKYFERYEYIPYMEKILNFKAGKGILVPAVCHVDGTGRVQSVSREMNSLFWDVIEEFRKLTGIPMVLNTSFNLNQEPIVHSVRDAVRTFYSCGIDAMIAGRYLVEK